MAEFMGIVRKLLRLPALLACAFVLLASVPVRAQVFDTSAPFAILTDASSGTVLFEKNADEPMPPASMAKLGLVDYVFTAIAEGRLSLTDEFVKKMDEAYEKKEQEIMQV